MKIWFGTTSAEIIKYYPYYSAIRNYLKDKEHEILFDWLDEAHNNVKQNGLNRKRNIKKIYQKVIDAIDAYLVAEFLSRVDLAYDPVIILKQLYLQHERKNS